MYLIFYGDKYYPTGGWDDFHGTAGSLDEAKDTLMTKEWDWCQVVDLKLLEVVYEVWIRGYF